MARGAPLLCAVLMVALGPSFGQLPAAEKKQRVGRTPDPAVAGGLKESWLNPPAPTGRLDEEAREKANAVTASLDKELQQEKEHMASILATTVMDPADVEAPPLPAPRSLRGGQVLAPGARAAAGEERLLRDDFTVEPKAYVSSREKYEEEKGLPEPRYVRPGYFARLRCEHFHNCTTPGAPRSFAPQTVPAGLIKQRSQQAAADRGEEAAHVRRADEALLTLSHVEEQQKVCDVVDDLRETAEFLFNARRDRPSELDKALGAVRDLAGVVCPQLKASFPLVTKAVNCTTVLLRVMSVGSKEYWKHKGAVGPHTPYDTGVKLVGQDQPTPLDGVAVFGDIDWFFGIDYCAQFEQRVNSLRNTLVTERQKYYEVKSRREKREGHEHSMVNLQREVEELDRSRTEDQMLRAVDDALGPLGDGPTAQATIFDATGEFPVVPAS